MKTSKPLETQDSLIELPERKTEENWGGMKIVAQQGDKPSLKETFSVTCTLRAVTGPSIQWYEEAGPGQQKAENIPNQ